MFDLISIGDSVLDTFMFLLDAEVEDSVGDERKLCLKYGEKIPVGPPVTVVAGNAANSAVGSARLKLKTAIYTNIGDDGDGERIKNTLKTEGVDTKYVVKDQNLPSNLHVILSFKGERTILTYHQPWRYALPDLDRARWVYLTSLSPTFIESGLINQVIRYLELTGARMLYNPGTFQIKAGVLKNPRLLSLTEVFIVNLEEAKIILGFKESESIPIKKLLKKIVDLGVKMVVITDGGRGSFGYDGERYLKLEAFPAKLVEMTGAGDSFATGVLARLFHGGSLAEAMRWGACNASSVVENVGPQTGLLTYNMMRDRLKENSKIQPREI